MQRRAVLGGVEVGDGVPVAVIGALNVSPESFYAGSVVRDRDQLLTAAQRMVEAGAVIVDVGGMSTAPYLATRISEAEEAERLARAVEWLAAKLSVPVSADTCRAGPARAALSAGATIVNDVSGLTADAEMAPLVRRTGAGLIVMANPRRPAAAGSQPTDVILGLLGETLALAREAGIDEKRVVVDPGIGFFRSSNRPWHEWDCRVLGSLGALAELRRPICVGVSRKSFIEAVAGAGNPEDRLPGSLAASAIAVFNGAHLIRCHDVAETRQAVRVAEAIRGQA
ncbi:MAG: dihydropteroate synthase [Candidatus Rokubacteria bacterium]|nr:dihydropteroate synthase [Candidatus Rokubacteria bacterium]